MRTNTAMSIAQNWMKEVNVTLARGVAATSVQAGLGQATSQGLFARSSKTTLRYLNTRLTWNMTFAKERETRIAAAWNAWRMLCDFWKAQVFTKYKFNVFEAMVLGAIFSFLCAFAAHNGGFTENAIFPWEACQNRLARHFLL